MQDGVQCHTAKILQQFWKSNVTEFWQADFWPTLSKDRNPLDYAIWGILEQATNINIHPGLDSLKETIYTEKCKKWTDFEKNMWKCFHTHDQEVIADNGSFIA